MVLYNQVAAPEESVEGTPVEETPAETGDEEPTNDAE